MENKVTDFVGDGEALSSFLTHAALYENSAGESIPAAKKRAVEGICIGLDNREFELSG